MGEPYRMRPMKRSDLHFIASTWLLSFSRSKYARGMGHAFKALHKPVVNHLIETADITVACNTDAEDVILGWLCTGGPDVVHYIVAKKTLHRAGVSSHLLKDMLGDRMHRRCRYTHHLIELYDAGCADILHEWKYDPYALAERGAHGDQESSPNRAA